LDDLVNGRVSHARAALETRKLYERQKGGWLFSGFGGAKTEEPPALPAPAQPEVVEPAPLREVFEEALGAKRDDVAVPVPEQTPGANKSAVAGPRAPLEGAPAKPREEREPAAKETPVTHAPVDDAGDPAS
jgi:hypothetical protein